jgi:hypothetical protein
MLNQITLANGKVVSWNEFSQWGKNKQKMSLVPHGKGKSRSAETRAKISKSNKAYFADEANLAKHKAALVGKNRTHSAETRAKISEAAKKSHASEETRAKRKATWYSKDRSLSEERKNKLRGIKRSEEFKAKLRGRKLSEEHKIKLRAIIRSEEFKDNLRGRKLSEATLAKRKATRAITMQWHTPIGTFPNKMAFILHIRDKLKLGHVQARDVVNSWIDESPEKYYRHNQKYPKII